MKNATYEVEKSNPEKTATRLQAYETATKNKRKRGQ